MSIDFKTLGDLAALSVAAYDDSAHTIGPVQGKLPEGWVALTAADLGLTNLLPLTLTPPGNQEFSANGYFHFLSAGIDAEAYAAINYTLQKIVIVFRGTEFTVTDPGSSILDVQSDIGIILGSLPLALAGMSDFINAVKNYASSNFPQYSLLAAGHSLGGALAEQLVASQPESFDGGLGMGSPGLNAIGNGFATNPNFVHIAHHTDGVGQSTFSDSHIGPTIIINDEDYDFFSYGWGAHNSSAYAENIRALGESPAFTGLVPSNLYNAEAWAYVAASDQAYVGAVPSLTPDGDSTYSAVIGSRFADDFNGTGLAHRLRIEGAGGSDIIRGGSVGDNLSGGQGVDFIYGGDGDDEIFGGDQYDDLRGEAGNDTIYGGSGGDSLFGGLNVDTLYGGIGIDTLRGEGGTDTLYGGADGDILFGDEDADTLDGGSGQDNLTGGSGSDTFVFGADAVVGSGYAVDIIHDFNRGNSGTFDSAEGDILDLRALITPEGRLQADANLVRFVARSDGSGLDVVVDPDGTGATPEFTVAFLKGVTSGAGIKVLTGAGGTSPTVVSAVGSPGSYTITPTSRAVDEGVGTITFTITRPVATQAETVYVSTTVNRGSANNSDYTGLLNVPVTFAAGDATETVTVTITNDTRNETAEQFGLILQSSPDQPASRYLASASFTIIDNDSNTGGTFTTGNDTVWLSPPPNEGLYVDGLAGTDTAVLDFRSLATGFTIYRSNGTLNAYTGGANPLSIANVEKFVVLGSDQADSVDLGQGGVVIARGGNDNIAAGAGVDVIDAGSGDDFIYNIGVGDVVEGGTGIDLLYFDVSSSTQGYTINLGTGQGAGGVWTGIERVSGTLGSGNDTVLAGFQLDYLHGGGGTNSLTADYSGALPDGRTAVGIDLYYYYYEPRISVRLSDNTQAFVDLGKFQNLNITGTAGNDSFDAGSGSRHFIGLGGNDTLTGGAQADILEGGDGNDYFQGVGLGDTVIGGDGIDTINLDLSSSTVGQTIDLLTGVGSGAVSWTGIERVSGTLGSGNDTVTAGFQADFLYGGGGTNSLIADYSGAMADGRTALWTNLYQYYGEARLSVRLSDNSQIEVDLVQFQNLDITGTAGNDVFDAGSGKRHFEGLGGDDTLYGGTAADFLDGGDGNDYFGNVGAGDTVIGGAGIDHVNVDLSTSTGGLTINTLTGVGSGGPSWIGVERVSGVLGSGSDTVVTGFQLDFLYGGGGTNSLTANYSGALPDGRTAAWTNLYYYYGEARLSVRLSDNTQVDVDLVQFQNFTITGSAGNDSFDAGTGARHFIGLGGDDTLVGGSAADILDGGDGNDYFGNVGIGDTVIGGAGIDQVSLDLSTSTGGLTVNTLTGVGSGGPSWTGIERVSGTLGSGNDTVVAGFQLDHLYGGGGTNSLTANYSGALPDGRTAVWTNLYYYYGEARLSVRLSDNTQVDVDLAQFQNLTITGSNGNDNFDAGTGSRHFIGLGGEDTLYGGTAADILDGGDGNDYFANVGIGDTVIGGAGIDHVNLNLSASTGGLTVNTLTGVGSGGPSWTGIERVSGVLGSGNDTVVAGFQLDDIYGGGGSNSLTASYSGAMADGRTVLWANLYTFFGETRISLRLSDNLQIDAALAQFQDLTITGSNGNDSFDAGTGSRHFFGMGGGDTLIGGAQADLLDGGDGDDYIYGAGGNDQIDGGAGFDSVSFSGNLSDYTITSIGPRSWRVTDNRPGSPDGADVVSNVESMLFNGNPYFPSLNLAGTANADVLVGDSGSDTITGEGGDDSIEGWGGNDTILGGPGNDTIVGGDGDDVFRVGLGAGTDSVSGGNGHDRIVATAANVVIGLSQLSGVEEIDAAGFAGVRILGNTAAQVWDFSNTTLNGVVSINGDGGNDVITGSAGNDTIIGNFGNDTMNGGAGDDTFQIGLSAGSDAIDGGSGLDRILATADNVVIGLTQVAGTEEIGSGGFVGVRIVGTSASQVLDFSTTALSGITSVDAGNGNDTVIGSAGDDSLLGGFGNDMLDGRGGKNTLTGGVGNDIYVVRTTNDKVVEALDEGTDRIDVQMNVFSIASLSQVENLTFTGAGSATLTGNALANAITGGIDNDTLNGGSGNDTIHGLAGHDTITGSFGSDLLEGNEGDDTFLIGLSAGFDTINGGIGYDRIQAVADNAIISLTGFSGIEEISSGGFSGVRIVTPATSQVLDFSTMKLIGIASIDAGSGNDTVIGSAGNDTIIGGFGNDVINGGEGDDTFLVGVSAGFDTFNGGGGYDRITASANNVAISLTAISGIEAISAAGFSGVRVVGTDTSQIMDFSAITLVGIAAIDGGRGYDTIIGSAANDVIIGGAGRDTITGGAGADRFVIQSAADSPASRQDTITDFLAGSDRIDLSAIDADGAGASLNAFVWLGTGAFTGTAGQLRYEKLASTTAVYGDTNGDGVADLQFTLMGQIDLGATDFVL